jgi:hypothetical protein
VSNFGLKQASVILHDKAGEKLTTIADMKYSFKWDYPEAVFLVVCDPSMTEL